MLSKDPADEVKVSGIRSYRVSRMGESLMVPSGDRRLLSQVPNDPKYWLSACTTSGEVDIVSKDIELPCTCSNEDCPSRIDGGADTVYSSEGGSSAIEGGAETRYAGSEV